MPIEPDKRFYAMVIVDINGNEVYQPIDIVNDIQIDHADKDSHDSITPAEIFGQGDSISIEVKDPPLEFIAEQQAILIYAWAGIHHCRLYHLLRNKKHRIKKKNAKRIINLYQQSRYYSKT